MALHPIQAPLNKARKDKFILVLTIPNVLKGLNIRTPRKDLFINLDSLQFSVYNITVPKIAIPEHALHVYGQNYNVTSYDRPPYPPVTVNFAIDNEFKNYWILWKWLQMINEPLKSTYADKTVFPGGQPPTIPEMYNYQTDIVVFALDEYNKMKAKFTFKWSFIVGLGELIYNYRDPEETDCYFDFAFNQLDITLLDGGDYSPQIVN
jgi:hypothetical protein